MLIPPTQVSQKVADSKPAAKVPLPARSNKIKTKPALSHSIDKNQSLYQKNMPLQQMTSPAVANISISSKLKVSL